MALSRGPSFRAFTYRSPGLPGTPEFSCTSPGMRTIQNSIISRMSLRVLESLRTKKSRYEVELQSQTKEHRYGSGPQGPRLGPFPIFPYKKSSFFKKWTWGTFAVHGHFLSKSIKNSLNWVFRSTLKVHVHFSTATGKLRLRKCTRKRFRG